MTYIELINRFWDLDEIWQFSCCETRLYFYLLKTANRLGWEDSWTHSDDKTSANVGVSKNTFKTARNRLFQAGLISFKEGGKGYASKTRYQITYQKMTPNPYPKVEPNPYPKVEPNPYPIYNKTKTKTKTKTKKESTNVDEKVEDSTSQDSCFVSFIEKFNTISRRSFKPIEKVRKGYNARLKEGFTSDDMINALKNAMAEKFHVDSGFKYLTPEFFTRSDKLEKYLNASNANPAMADSIDPNAICEWEIVPLANVRKTAYSQYLLDISRYGTENIRFIGYARD